MTRSNNLLENAAGRIAPIATQRSKEPRSSNAYLDNRGPAGRRLGRNWHSRNYSAGALMSGTTPKRPSEIVRDALRKWVRDCAAWDRKDPAQDPSRLSKNDLRGLIRTMGGNPDVIAARALNDADAGTTTLPQDDEQDTTPMPLDTTPGADTQTTPDPDALLEGLRDKLVDGGFSAVRAELRQIIAKSQRPPVVVERVVERIVHAAAPLPAGAHDLRPARASTWGELFGLTACSRAAGQPITVWDHPAAPKANPAYQFPQAETALALSQMSRSEASRAKGAPAKHVLLIGPAGTGKSAWPREFAARTGRPFVTIPLSDGIEMDQLMGQTVLDGQGGTKWQDGLLLGAIRQPGMVICLDEVGGMRAAVGVAMNGLLQDMVYYVPDTGERVPVARGVVFVATNNATLMDGGAAKGYVGVGRQNRAFADRFGATIEIGYAPEAIERSLLQTYTGCTPELAKVLVEVATLSRAKAASDDITHGIGFRRLIAWAECLMDGADPALAFQACVLNSTTEADGEILRQLALVAINPTAIRRAVRGEKVSTQTPSAAGAQFTDVSGEEG